MCQADGENVAGCSVTFSRDGTVTKEDVNSEEGLLGSPLLPWATVPAGVDIAAATGMVEFVVTQRSMEQIGGSIYDLCSGSAQAG